MPVVSRQSLSKCSLNELNERANGLVAGLKETLSRMNERSDLMRGAVYHLSEVYHGLEYELHREIVHRERTEAIYLGEDMYLHVEHTVNRGGDNMYDVVVESRKYVDGRVSGSCSERLYTTAHRASMGDPEYLRALRTHRDVVPLIDMYRQKLANSCVDDEELERDREHALRELRHEEEE